MTPHRIDVLKFVQDHEVFLELLDRPDWTDAELESLESLESVLEDLREKLLHDNSWDYTAMSLEEARTFDCEVRADEDAANSPWKQLPTLGRIILMTLLAHLVVNALWQRFKA